MINQTGGWGRLPALWLINQTLGAEQLGLNLAGGGRGRAGEGIRYVPMQQGSRWQSFEMIGLQRRGAWALETACCGGARSIWAIGRPVSFGTGLIQPTQASYTYREGREACKTNT